MTVGKRDRSPGLDDSSWSISSVYPATTTTMRSRRSSISFTIWSIASRPKSFSPPRTRV